MKVYDRNTRFSFGKYEGKPLAEVFEQDPAYVEKCMLTVEDFAIDQRSLQKLLEDNPDVEFSDTAIDTNIDKLDAMEMEDNEFYTDDVYDDDFEDLDEASEKFDKEDDDDFSDDDETFPDDDDFSDDWDDADDSDDWDDDDDDDLV